MEEKYKLLVEQVRPLNMGGNREVAEFFFHADSEENAKKFRDDLLKCYSDSSKWMELRQDRLYHWTINGGYVLVPKEN